MRRTFEVVDSESVQSIRRIIEYFSIVIRYPNTTSIVVPVLDVSFSHDVTDQSGERRS
jgi:hypothetical protein